jgi:class 3 adenylate cyclase
MAGDPYRPLPRAGGDQPRRNGGGDTYAQVGVSTVTKTQIRAPKDSDSKPLPPGRSGQGAAIDDLLDRAVAAINRGDRAAATALAGQVLAFDQGNVDAEDLLAAPADAGEIRRLTILFTDLVDSTVLSTKVEPETYRLLVGRYREQVLRIVDRYGGHIGSTKGDGLLVVFGYPDAHENDVRRAVQAGLEVTREVAQLSEQAKRRFDVGINVRVGVHRGMVYLDRAQDDVYGLAANLAARVSGLAPPGAVVVSDAVEPLIRDAFVVDTLPAAPVKGVEGLINHSRVVGERVEVARFPLGPVVGRDRELARLHRSWSRAQAGTLTTPGVVFRGEPGIGKSRLAAAATELVERDGGVVLELVGSPFHPDVGLHPVRALLERRCGIDRLTPPAQRLERLDAEVTAQGLDPDSTTPLLAPVLAIAPERGYESVPAEGRKLQDLIADAVRRYLLACFDDAGLLLVEDMHWFDPSTTEVLGGLLGATGGRLLVVITGRDGNWLPDDWPVKVFDLTPLTDEQSDALILALDPTVSAEDRAAVRERCDGVPFYIEQVVSGLDSTGTENRPPVPDPLYEPLFARLLTTPNVVPVVEAAAIIGRYFDRDLLLAVSGLREEEVDDVLDELEDARVLEPCGSDSWRFRHELLREVAAELAPPSVRRGLHAKIAEALLDGAAGDPDWRLVAAHYEHAERYADAAAAYQQASEDARRRGTLTEARSYLDHVVTQLECCPTGSERDRAEIASRLQRGFLASAAEGYQSPAVADDFERCLEIVGTDVRDDQLFATLLALCSYYVPRADLGRAAQLLEVVRAATEEGRQWFRPAIESGLGMVAYLRGQYDVARGHFEQATAGVAEDDEHHIEALWFIPDDPIALAHEHLALHRILHGDLPGAEAQFRKAFERAGQLGFPQGPYNHVYATDLEILMRVEASQFDRARALVGDLLERAERYGFDFWQMFGLTEQCLVDCSELLTGAAPDAAALAAQIDAMTGFVELWRSVGLNAYQTQYDCVLAQLLLAAGRPEVARARVATALQLAEDTEMHMYDAELLRVRARTDTDTDARAADLAAAVELARRQDAPLFELRAALDDFDWRGESARAVLAEAVDRLPADSSLPELTRARALLG